MKRHEPRAHFGRFPRRCVLALAVAAVLASPPPDARRDCHVGPIVSSMPAE